MDRPTCSCGHDRGHTMVSHEPEYTRWGAFWVFFFGVSYTPIHVGFRCRVCGELFDTEDDAAELERYV